MAKKTLARPKAPTKKSASNISGGVDVDADEVNITGDVVGRDKYETTNNFSIPRGVQIAIGLMAIALVAIAVVIITRPTNIPNGNFADGLNGWQTNGGVRVVATGEPATSPVSQNAAEFQIGGVLQMTVTINNAWPQLTVWYQWPPSSAARGRLNIYLDNQLQIALDQIAVQSPGWNVAVVSNLSNYAGKAVSLKLEYALAAARSSGGHLAFPAMQQRDVLWVTNVKFVSDADLAEMGIAAVPSPKPELVPTVSAITSADTWPLVHTLEISEEAYNLVWALRGRLIRVNTINHLLSWDLQSNQVLSSAVDGVKGVWSPDGKQIATFGGAGTIVIWDGTSQTVLRSDVRGLDSGVYSLAWSPDGQKIVAGSLDGTVPIWDLASKTVKRLPGHDGAVYKVAWSPDGKQIASGGADGTVKVWDVADGHQLQSLPGGYTGLTWSPDSQEIAVNGKSVYELDIWSTVTGQRVAVILADNIIRAIQWSPDGAYIVTSDFEIIDVRAQQSLGILKDMARYSSTSSVWSPDSTQLAFGVVQQTVNGNQYSIRVWQVPTATPMPEPTIVSNGFDAFSSPRGVAVDGEENVYVVDSSNNRVLKFNRDGVYLTQWGSEGNGDGQFIGPAGIAVDVKGNVYVADTANQRIQKFNSDGIYLSQWGSFGDGKGQFSNPVGIAVDTSGNVYVADSNNRVQEFSGNGDFRLQWGSLGKDVGQFSDPKGIAINEQGIVYVADSGNNRIQKFSGRGGYLEEWFIPVSENEQTNGLSGLAIDNRGNIYVTDVYNNRIQVFNSDGKSIAAWGSLGSGKGQFNGPVSIAVDSHGNVYVADSGNNLIQVFSSSGDYLTQWFGVGQ